MILRETMLSRYHFNRRVVHLVNEGAQSALDPISRGPPLVTIMDLSERNF
jgi:hypothetical protein